MKNQGPALLLWDVFRVIWQVSYMNSANSRKPKDELIKTLLALVPSATAPWGVSAFVRLSCPHSPWRADSELEKALR